MANEDEDSLARENAFLIGKKRAICYEQNHGDMQQKSRMR